MTGERSGIESLTGDRRAVTVNNTAAVATLLVFTLVIGGGLGGAILFASDEDAGGPPGANFTYRYIDSNSALIVTFSEGDRLPAGEVLISDTTNNATWAAVANYTASKKLEQGDIIQLSESSAFGSSIISTEKVEIYWTGGNETIKLDQWDGSNQTGF